MHELEKCLQSECEEVKVFVQDSRGVLFRGPWLRLLGVLGTSLACPLCVSASWAFVF